MKKALSVLLATVLLLTCIPLSTVSVSAARSVINIAISQFDTVIPSDGYIYEDYGSFYFGVLTDCFDYTVSFSDGTKCILSYYDLEDIGITIDEIIYCGEIYDAGREGCFFVAGRQPVIIQCGSDLYDSYVTITSFLEWCSSLNIKTDYDDMYIDYEDQEQHNFFWRIKPDQTNIYAFYSSGWDNIKAHYTIFDKNDCVVKYTGEGWNLKKGNEYCLRISYMYNDYCYSDITFQMEPLRGHTHRFSAATCTKPRTCKDCGFTSGKKLGHIYANDCDKTCNRCKATRTVSAHTYKKVVVKKATQSANGSYKNVCTKCGYTASKRVTLYKASSVKLSTGTYTYNGSVKKPTVTVKDSNGKTISSSHYTVTYASGRKNVGTYKVTVKFKNYYSGTKTLTFKINPAKTSVKSLTAGKKSLKVAINKKTAQVSGYQIQYSTSKSFKSYKTKTLSGYKKTSTTLTGLSAKKTYYVRVRTYKTVNGKKVYSGWSTIKYKKTK